MIRAFLFFTITVTSISVTCCEASPSVLIVGAGASGIAAATKLVGHGMNVTLLEAQQRIGGRIRTVGFGDAVVDLGAQWSHGEQNNTMYELVKDLDLLRPSNFTKHFHYSGDNFDHAAAERLFDAYKAALSKVPARDESIGRFFTEKFCGESSNAVLESFRHDVLIRGAFSWDNLSMISNYDRLKGSSYLNWNGRGHGVVLDVMMKRYPDPEQELPVADNVVLGKEVDEIVWNGDLVNVRCSDGSEYFADHVILTVSLGVLKSRCASMFKPSLPEAKLNVIKDLGMEAVAKVALHFPNKWWQDDDFCTALLCWDGTDLKRLSENGKLWLENLYELQVVEKNPRVLMAWFTGEFVPEIETLPDDVVIDGVTFVLDMFFGKRYNVTGPDKILRHNWYSDPHFRGVYSFETVKSRQGKEFGAATLSQPLMSDRGKLALLFGGEATSPTHYATVHGAIEAGYREASRIINLYQ